MSNLTNSNQNQQDVEFSHCEASMGPRLATKSVILLYHSADRYVVRRIRSGGVHRSGAWGASGFRQ